MSTLNPTSSNTNDWSDYYAITRNSPPRPLLVTAVTQVHHKNQAIDIGGGALVDTRYLLKAGFEVTVIDRSPLLLQEAATLSSDRLHAYITSFEDFDFGVQQYDLATAMFSLPFNPPQSFNQVFENIKRSIVPAGIFCGQFFGIHDQWSGNEKNDFSHQGAS